MRCLHRLVWPTLTVLSSLPFLALAQTKSGPLAPISIHSDIAYSTARPCAAGCLVYQGVWHCGVNGGYHDLGQDLGCGCSPNNACFCSTGLPASSYISSCVSAGCKNFAGWEGDLTSILGLYDGYCSTANKAVASSTSTRVSSAKTGTATAGATVDGQSASETNKASGNQSDTGGLTTSAKVGMGVALGLGIPLIIIAATALFLCAKRKRNKAAAIAPPVAPAQPLNNKMYGTPDTGLEVVSYGQHGAVPAYAAHQPPNGGQQYVPPQELGGSEAYRFPQPQVHRYEAP
jgi:hypothetical protein